MINNSRSLSHKNTKKSINMNSIMHSTSQFDKGNQSTIDGTQMSIQNKFEARTDLDPYEQRHNCMNLALGKPT